MRDTSDTFDLLGRTFAEKYKVEGVVARGGFGVVYRARHIELDTPVALKVLMVPERFCGALRVEFLEMFKREARTIGALAHPAIVRVLDYGAARFASGEAPWMTLEWLEGRTLEADLGARSAHVGRSPVETLALLRPAFDALSVAHAAGVAHRDIKPANLMLVRARRGEPGLRVLDFGIAKVMETGEEAGSGQTATRTELSSYSLGYAAPEQVSQARTGPWTDVHALALIAVELLTGRRAYRSTDPVAIFADVLDRERPSPARVGVDVGPWETVLARALALLPAERHPDADDLLAALEVSVDRAEIAWQAGRAHGASAAVTVPAAVTAPGAPPDTLVGASVVRHPPPPRRTPGFVPLVAGVALALSAFAAWKATRAAVPGPRAATAVRVPVAAAPRVVAAPPVVVALPVPAPAAVAPVTLSAPALRRAPPPRLRSGQAAPVVARSPAAPVTAPGIVIE
jgi:serine/threonine protein kinase